MDGIDERAVFLLVFTAMAVFFMYLIWTKEEPLP